MLDVNGDGLITKDDISVRANKIAKLRHISKSSAHYEEIIGADRDHYAQVMSTFGKHVDGNITREEYHEFLGRNLTNVYFTIFTAIDTFRVCDTNRDDKVGWEEYKAYGDEFGYKMDRGIFDELDSDKDGFLTVEDLKAAMQIYFRDTEANDPANHMLGKIN